MCRSEKQCSKRPCSPSPARSRSRQAPAGVFSESSCRPSAGRPAGDSSGPSSGPFRGQDPCRDRSSRPPRTRLSQAVFPGFFRTFRTRFELPPTAEATSGGPFWVGRVGVWR